jgi:hypothetical protein
MRCDPAVATGLDLRAGDATKLLESFFFLTAGRGRENARWEPFDVQPAMAANAPATMHLYGHCRIMPGS